MQQFVRGTAHPRRRPKHDPIRLVAWLVCCLATIGPWGCDRGEEPAPPAAGAELGVLHQALAPPLTIIAWADIDFDGRPDDSSPKGWFNGDEVILVATGDECVKSLLVDFEDDLCGVVQAQRSGDYLVAACNLKTKTSFKRDWAIPVSGTYVNNPLSGCFGGNFNGTTAPELANVDTRAPTAPGMGAFSVTGGNSPYPAGCTAGVNCYWTKGDTMSMSWTANQVDRPRIDYVDFIFSSFSQRIYNRPGGVYATSYSPVDSYQRGTVRAIATAYSGSKTYGYYPAAGQTTHADTRVTTVDPKYFSITGSTGHHHEFRSGDTVTVTWDDGPNGNNNGDDYYYRYVDFSSFGGGLVTMAPDPGVPTTFRASYTIQPGAIDLSDASLRVTIRDHGGHGVTNLKIGQPAQIGSFLVNDGPLWSEALTLSCLDVCTMLYPATSLPLACSTVNGHLNHRAYLSGYGTDLYCEGDGADENFVRPYTGAPYDCGVFPCSTFSAYATDWCQGSRNYCWSTLTVDNQAPTVKTANIVLSGGSGPQGTFNASDSVTVTWNSATDGNGDIWYVVGNPGDLGGAPFPLALQGDGTTYRGSFVPGAPIDAPATTFQLVVDDDAGNQTSAPTPTFALDNKVPTGSASQIAFVNPPAVYKVGDPVTVQWTNNAQTNPDLISAQVDFGSIGRGLVDAVRAGEKFTASTTVPEGGTAARSFTVTVRPRDDAYNVGSISSGSFCIKTKDCAPGAECIAGICQQPVDARSPVVVASAISVSNTTPGREDIFPLRIGDTVQVVWDTTADLPPGVDPGINGDVSSARLICTEMYINALIHKEGSIWYYNYGPLPATGFDTNDARCRIEAFDPAGNMGSATRTGVSLDLKQPTITAAAIQVTGKSGEPNGTTFKVGDTMSVSWDAVADANSDVTAVWIDFSSLGGAKVPAAGPGPVWSAAWSVPAGNLDTTQATVLLTAEDDAGNTRADVASLTFRFDNQLPFVHPAQPITLAGSGGEPVQVGDRVTLTWVMGTAGGPYPGNADIRLFSGDFAAFGGGVLTMNGNPIPSDPSPLLVLDPVPAGTSDVPDAAVAAITIRDDAGNELHPTANTLAVDNWPPVVRAQDITVTVGAGGDGNPIFKVGEDVVVRWNSLAPGGGANADLTGPGAQVTFDFTALGAAGPVVVQGIGGVYEASHRITEAAGVFPADAAVIVRARDDAANAGSAAVTVSIDRSTPVVAGGSFKVMKGGVECTAAPPCAFKKDDTVAVSWDPAGDTQHTPATRTVRFDFSGLGGGLVPVAGLDENGEYSASYTVVAGAIRNVAASVGLGVTDPGGNGAAATSVAFRLDNQPPQVLFPPENDEIVVSGAGADGRFVPGETATATWQPPVDGGGQLLPPNTDMIEDGTPPEPTVAIDLSDFGCPAPGQPGAPPVTRNGNRWSASCQLPVGVQSNPGAQAVVTARDDVGNSAQGASSGWPVDGGGPKVSTANITVERRKGDGGWSLCTQAVPCKFKTGDVARVSWNNAAEIPANPALDHVDVDFSQFGTAQPVRATLGGGVYQAVAPPVPAGTPRLVGAAARVIAYDTHQPPLVGNGLSPAHQRVDGVAPVVVAGAMSFHNSTGTPAGTFKIGDSLTVEWNGAVNTDLSPPVQFDFSACGGPSLVAVQEPLPGQPGVYRASFVVAAGAIDTDTGVQPRVAVTATDDVGNSTTGLSSPAMLDSIPPTVTAGRIAVTGATGMNGAFFIVGDLARVTWDDSVGGDDNTDAIAAVRADLSQLGGGAAVELKDIGGACDAAAGDERYGGGCVPLPAAAIDRDNAAVTVRVTDNAGNQATATTPATIRVDLIRPVITTLNDLAANEGAEVGFSATVTGALTYLWTFGDGSPPSSQQGPKHTYADDGDYPVTLRVTDDAGNQAERAATARIANVAPTVVGVNLEANEGGALADVLVASFSDPGSVDTHTALIDWGDGSPPVAGAIDPAAHRVNGTHTYTADGVFQASVTVTDDDEGSGLGRFTVTVRNVAPTIDSLSGNGEAAPVIDEGGTVVFTGVASDPGADDGQLVWRWEFGDGTSEEGAGLDVVSHGYASDSSGMPQGRYVVTLTVTDSDGASASATLPVVVQNVAPTVQPLAPLSGDEGAALTLSATASDPGDPVLTYHWDVDLEVDSSGDGVPDNDRDLEGQTVQTVYRDSRGAPYRAAVVVVDDDGLTARAETTVTVANVPPTVALQLPHSIAEGTVVNGVCTAGSLQAIATLGDASPVDAAAGFRVTWDFGDGSAAVVQEGVKTPAQAAHVFGDDVLPGGAASPFTVALRVEDKDGGETSASQPVEVVNVPPFALAGVQVGANVITGSYSTPEAVEITLTGSRSCDPGQADALALTYDWDFGDGSAPAQGQSVAHTFYIGPEGLDLYTVTLTVTDPQGATGQSTLEITVDEQIPIPELWVDLSAGAEEGRPLVFMGSVTNPIDGELYTYIWQWGDGSPDEEGEVTEHAFPDDGSYDVLLGARTERGTVGWTLPFTIEVTNAVPAVAIVRESNLEVGEGDRVGLRAQVDDPGSADTHTYRWDCDGDPQTVEGEDSRVECPTVNEGTLQVELVVTDDDGGQGTAALDVPVVNRPPVALPPPNQLNVPEGTVLELQGGGSDPGTQDQLAYTWYLPDDSAVSGQVLSYTVVDEGDISLELEVTDDGEPPLTSPRAATLVFATNVPPAAAICASELDPQGLDPAAPPEDCLQQDVQGEEGEELQLTALAADPGITDLLTYAWSFDAAHAQWETAVDPADPHMAHVFPDEGEYPIWLEVQDGDGGQALALLTVTIVNADPSIVAFGDVAGAEGSLVHLQAEVTDPGNDPLTYRWDFGDGRSASTETPMTDHLYADSGTYEVLLTVADDAGGTAQGTAQVEVANLPPGATAEGPLVALEGEELTFVGGGSDPSPRDAAALTYLWSFGDGTDPVEGRVVSHAYADEGEGRYEATLTVTDPDGGQATAAVRLLVSNVRPELAELPDLAAEEGIPITFTAPATDPGSADELIWTWSVGAAAPVQTRLPELQWTFPDDQPAPVLVRVEVEDGDGGSDSTSFNVQVANRPPRFVADPPPPATALQGDEYGYTLRAEDDGEDALTFVLEAAPEGMELLDEQGAAVLRWIPALDQSELAFPVSVRVADGDGGEDVLAWLVQVEGFRDTDGDGLPDSFEELVDDLACLNPEVADADQDVDGDGLTALQEFQRDVTAGASSPCRANTPGAPSVHLPALGAEVDTPTPELWVNNAADPDAAAVYAVLADIVPLGYQFEVGRELGTQAAEIVADNLPAEGEGEGDAPGRGAEGDEPWVLCSRLTPESAEGRTGWAVPADRLEENATYQWRVRACDGWAFGPWMDVASFIVNAVEEPPGAPSLLAPLEEEVVATPSPIVRFANTTDPDGDALAYRVELYADREAVGTPEGLLHASDPPVPGQAGPSTDYDLGEAGVALVDDTRPCVRVQAVDDTGLAGPWSELRCFRVNAQNQAPGVPELVSPATVTLALPERWTGGVDVTEVAGPQVELVFRGAVDPDGDGSLVHQVEIDAAPSFDSPALQRSPDGGEGVLTPGAGDQASWTPPAALEDHTLYWWRVRATDGQAWGEPALGLLFVNATNEAPHVPVLVSPEEGEQVAELQPLLVLQNPADADPDRDAVTYELAVARDSGFAESVAAGEVAAGEADTVAWQPAEALPGGALWWRARARDDGGLTSEWSAPVGFTRVVEDTCSALLAPVPQSPVAGEPLSYPATPLLMVQNSTGCEGQQLLYEFRLFRVEQDGRETPELDEPAVVNEGPDGTTGFQVAGELGDAHRPVTYSWNARARVAGAEIVSPWSDTVRFQVLPDKRRSEVDADEVKLSGSLCSIDHAAASPGSFAPLLLLLPGLLVLRQGRAPRGRAPVQKAEDPPRISGR